MAKFKELEDRKGTGIYWFMCPGCKCSHIIHTNLIYGTGVWKFNGDVNKPSICPSYLIRWDYGEQMEHHRCHSLIENGMIQFLDDCTHDLAGQTVELPEIDL